MQNQTFRNKTRAKTTTTATKQETKKITSETTIANVDIGPTNLYDELSWNFLGLAGGRTFKHTKLRTPGETLRLETWHYTSVERVLERSR